MDKLVDEFLTSAPGWFKVLLVVAAIFSTLGGALVTFIEIVKFFNREKLTRVRRGLLAGLRVAVKPTLFLAGCALGVVVLTAAFWIPGSFRTGGPPCARDGEGGADEISNSLGMKLRRIQPGTADLGTPEGERPREANEGTVHATFERPFYLGVHEVTQAQYQKVMGKNPSHFSAEGSGCDKVVGLDTRDFPVDSVSWHDALAFCAKLSELPEERKAGRKYRLPSEAEWEYACRAGTKTAYAFGAKLSRAQANFGNALPRPARVGSYEPNAWGLCDMHGNVREWCACAYAADRSRPASGAGGSRVIRGGSWDLPGRSCRSAFRDRSAATDRFVDVGFRVALTP